MAQADIGIGKYIPEVNINLLVTNKCKAVGSASNLAQEASDVVLMTNNLTQLLVAIDLAVKVTQTYNACNLSHTDF